MRHLTLLMILFAQVVFAQQRQVFHIDSLSKEGVILDKGWKWQAGDNPDWAKPDFDDSKWESIDPTRTLSFLPQIQKSPVGWLRIHIQVDTYLVNKALAFQLFQTAASEIFLNGHLLKTYGTIKKPPGKVKAYNPVDEPQGIMFNQKDQLIAIRFSVQEGFPPYAYSSNSFKFFQMRIREINHVDRFAEDRILLDYLHFIYLGFFLLLGLIHLAFYVIVPSKRANLYFSLFAFSCCLRSLLYICISRSHDVDIKVYGRPILNVFTLTLYSLFLLMAIYELFPKKKGFYHWFLIVYLFGTCFLLLFIPPLIIMAPKVPFILTNVFSLQIVTKAYLQGKRSTSLLVFGIGGQVVFYFIHELMFYNLIPNLSIGHGFNLMDVLWHAAVICTGTFFSFYLSKEFANTSIDLEQKLNEVRSLSEEKQQILSIQNQTLERQVAERTAELSTKNRELELEAALERVRANIASMRSPDDLQRITPLIWKELSILNVPFIRCGVFIMDEDAQKVHSYLSTPEGQALASFQLGFESEGNIPELVRHWRSQTIFLDHWDAHQFRAWTQRLTEQGLLQSSESYLTLEPPPQLFLHFAPFLQGMLYVGNTTSLNQDQIQVVQQLANAFASAYARYQDFSQLEIAKQKVENTLQELRSTQAQLIQSEKLASLGELTAGIAHEIQNPLNFVNNFSEVSAEMLDEMHQELEKGDTTEAIAIATDLKTNLEKIKHHGQRASSIVKGMLEHSGASTGVKEHTNINALADEYLRLAYHGLRAKDNNFNATMETHFDPDLPKISVIPQDIGRVLLNLINNAFYAVAEKAKQGMEGYQATVAISSRKLENAIEVRVQDNGNGIPESIKDKIFQPFFTTKPTGQGTGLGLSLAYDIVTKGHSGTINLQSKTGEGSTFSIWLPI